ncbi:winged helix-turn-helix domain-containing protein [Colwellia sp. MEBiC06753]
MAELYKIGNVTIDLKHKVATFDDGNTVKLSPIQSKILTLLLHSPGNVVPHATLKDTVWKGKLIEEKTYSSAFRRLRDKLNWGKDEYLFNEHGEGYLLRGQIIAIEQDLAPTLVNEQTSEQENEQKSTAPKNHTKSERTRFKWLIASASLIFLAFLLALITSKTQTLAPIKVTPLPKTYIEGVELRPAVSPDGKYLAFSHSQTGLERLSVKVKNLHTNEYLDLITSDYSTSPNWNSRGTALYFSSFDNGQCWISRALFQEQQFLPPENLISCGVEPSESQPQIDNNEDWLYFTFKSDISSPSIVKRMHLRTGNVESMTVSESDGYGDYSINISPDATKLAILNTDASYISHLDILDLQDGSRQRYFDYEHLMFNVSWAPDGNSVFFIDGRNTIAEFKFKSKTKHQLATLEQAAYSISTTNDSKMYIGYGNIYQSDIKRLDPTDFSIQTVINSTFDDYSPAIMKNDKASYFISNRSGLNQIWIAYDGKQIQVSNYTIQTKISDLILSPSENYLAYLKDGAIEIREVDLEQSKVIMNTSDTPVKYRNLTWSCNQDKLYLSSKMNNIWGLSSLDIKSKVINKERENVSGIQFDCQTNQKYLTKENQSGIFVESSNEEFSDKHILQNVNLIHNDEWAIYHGQVFFRYEGNLYLNKGEKYQPIDITAFQTIYDVTFTGNNLYFSKQALNDTYIAEVVLKSQK